MIFPFFFVWGPGGGLIWPAVSLAGMVVLWIILNVLFAGARRRHPDDAEEILRERLARGEIDEETYIRLRDRLRR